MKKVKHYSYLEKIKRETIKRNRGKIMKVKIVITIYLSFLLLINLGSTAYFQIFNSFSNIDANLEELDHYLKEQKFNGNILVGHKGEILFENSYGFQDYENGIRNQPETAFLIGSGSKQFTAAAILKLEEQQKLNIKDTIHQYLPQVPNGEQITIHQLMTHTSGLPDYLNYLEKSTKVGLEWTTNQIIEEMANKPTKDAPGKSFNYNNYGYVLLGAVIESITGENYETYIQTELLTPSEMSQTGFGYIPSQSETAIGYMDDKYEVARYVHPSFAHAGGALSSTTRDLYKWHQALASEKLLSNKSKEKMFQSHTEKSLLPGQSYGYGNYIVKEGEKMYHPGFIDGFSSNIYRDTKNDLVIIVLSNMDSSFLPAIPAFLNDFSEQVQNSYIGYLGLTFLILLMAWATYILIKWLRGFQNGSLILAQVKWYRIVFQTSLLQLIAVALAIIPFVPALTVDLISSNHLLFVAAPIWGLAVNLIIVLFVLASIGAIQPFMKNQHVESVKNEGKTY
jgi:CubicO group peptidase (beta-lactamase class C family)